MNVITKTGPAVGECLAEKPLSLPCTWPLEMKRALSEGEFSLVYQPMIELDCGRITSCEALLRWNHPVCGTILPGEFVKIAEDTGVMPRLGGWVLRAALAQAATWPDEIKVAVNVSAAQFLTGDLPQVVWEALAASSFDPRRLELEMTETIQPSADNSLRETLHQLRRIGVRLSIDDFGVGHSSLHRLRGFAFDKIKIDRSFVNGFPERADHAAFIRAVIGLGTELGMTTTAEGAETRSQVEELRAARCTEVQGFFFSRARPTTEIRDFLSLAQREGLPDSRPEGGTASRSPLPRGRPNRAQLI
jgi:EAL domain-containing protein (putative c-di-GMP-specific phosphodiesterase class I)